MLRTSRHNPNYPRGKRTLFHATKFALTGFKQAFNSEAAIRLEVYIIIAAIPIALLISKDFAEFILLILPCFLLIIVELLNTAIEATVNRISLERHPLSKIAKDASAAAVFVTAVLTAVIWIAKIIWFI